MGSSQARQTGNVTFVGEESDPFRLCSKPVVVILRGDPPTG